MLYVNYIPIKKFNLFCRELEILSSLTNFKASSFQRKLHSLVLKTQRKLLMTLSLQTHSLQSKVLYQSTKISKTLFLKLQQHHHSFFSHQIQTLKSHQRWSHLEAHIRGPLLEAPSNTVRAKLMHRNSQCTQALEITQSLSDFLSQPS